MDLYKYAMWFSPFIASELVADCFALARQARELDMRAAPYDLVELGYEPIHIETPEGRREYGRLAARGGRCGGTAARPASWPRSPDSWPARPEGSALGATRVRDPALATRLDARLQDPALADAPRAVDENQASWYSPHKIMWDSRGRRTCARRARSSPRWRSPRP